jgi:RNA polymerase sigma-70 factor, ECF subfamily
VGTGADSSSDEELAKRLFAGDEHAAEILIERYRRPLFGLLYRLTGNAADAEELFQDTFLRALRASSTFDTSRRFKPWITTIAVNLGRDLLGRRAHAATPELRAPEDLPESEGVDRESEWVLRGDLARALSTLPEGQGEVVLLRYFEGLEEAEIAKSVGIPRGTVKSRLHHALRKMREALTGEAP